MHLTHLRAIATSPLPLGARARLCWLEANASGSDKRGGKRPRRDVRIPVARDLSVRLRGPSVLIDYKAFRDIFVDRFFRFERPGAVVIDAGAHCGYFGAYALVGGARAVYSLEPETANFHALEHTAAAFRRAGYDWETEQVALGATDGVAELHISSESWSHSLRTPASGTTVDVESVRTRRLAPILSELSTTHPGRPLVVKLNIEGAAGEVILSTPGTDWAAVEQVLFDFEPGTPEPIDVVLGHLRAAGFVVLWQNGRDFRLGRQ